MALIGDHIYLSFSMGFRGQRLGGVRDLLAPNALFVEVPTIMCLSETFGCKLLPGADEVTQVDSVLNSFHSYTQMVTWTSEMPGLNACTPFGRGLKTTVSDIL